MRQLSRYAYANTRIRAMISRILDEEFFARVASVSMDGFIEILGKTSYAEVLKRLGENFRPEDFENECRSKDREIIRKIAKFYYSKNERELIFSLDERYTVEELKNALRLWRRKIKGEDVEIHGRFSGIFSAKGIDDVIKILKGSPYSEAVRKARENYLKLDSLFPVEVSIDTEYFKKLGDSIKKLSVYDRTIAKKIIGAQIDRENLSWLGRIHLYYQGRIPAQIPGFIPGGSYISIEELNQVSGSLPEAIQRIKIPQVYRELVAFVPHNLEEMDRLLEGIIMQIIKKVFVEKPFSIGIPVGYVFLKLAETKRIISIITMKYFAVSVYQ